MGWGPVSVWSRTAHSYLLHLLIPHRILFKKRGGVRSESFHDLKKLESIVPDYVTINLLNQQTLSWPPLPPFSPWSRKAPEFQVVEDTM